LFEQNPAVTNDKCVSFDKSLCERFGFLDRQHFRIFCATEFIHRADAAFWFIRHANECAQIDQRGVETRCIAFRNKLRGVPPESFTTDGRINRGAHVEQASEYARAIRFDNWDRLIEGKCCDCVRCIAANAGQVANRSDVAGESPTVPIPYNLGGGMKIPGAIIVAEPLPGVEDFVLRSARNRSEIGKSAEPFIIIRDHGGHLSLLKHELGNKNGIGIAGFAPWKITAVAAKPAEKRASERANVFWRCHDSKETFNVQRSTSNSQFRR
jgi:hypothetical protein